MNRNLTERQVLEELGIEDFRHLSKDNVIQLASNLDKMDKEVAFKALDQFSEFSSVVTNAVNEYFDQVKESKNVLKHNHDSFVAICENEQQVLLSLIKDDMDVSEKYEIMDRLREIRQDISSQVDKDRNFLFKEIGIISAAVVTVAGTVATVLGGNVNFRIKGPKN